MIQNNNERPERLIKKIKRISKLSSQEICKIFGMKSRGLSPFEKYSDIYNICRIINYRHFLKLLLSGGINIIKLKINKTPITIDISECLKECEERDKLIYKKDNINL